MTALRLSVITFVGATAALAALVATSAKPGSEPAQRTAGKDPNQVIQYFPSKGAKRTGWKIRQIQRFLKSLHDSIPGSGG